MFGGFRIRIDPWEVDYGDQTPLSPTDDDGPRPRVDHEIEVPESDWGPIVPDSSATTLRRARFIDGIRRLEARLHARVEDRLVHGAFGSYAVGAVELDERSAHFGELRVARTVVLGAGRRLPDPVPVRRRLTYVPDSTPSAEPEAPLRQIQMEMRLAEATLASELHDDRSLTIVDGPLTFEPQRRGPALGYIKRLHELYLPPALLSRLAALPAGARTPLFSIESSQAGFPRLSWFQRLAAAGPGVSELHGLVRLEADGREGLEATRRLADSSARWLPRLAPTRARDPRSPQNLLPIGALEQQLRAQLGDARLIRRWIEDLVAREDLRD